MYVGFLNMETCLYLHGFQKDPLTNLYGILLLNDTLCCNGQLLVLNYFVKVIFTNDHMYTPKYVNQMSKLCCHSL